MDKFCLKWNEFDTNIREYFKKLRKEHSLFDVTLATDDGRKLQAHKVILSAGSDFFNEIFTTNIHTNIVIYLKGISSVDLSHIADFMYNGEASVSQEELTSFLETGKELKVKGLLAEMRGVPGSSQKDDHDNYTDKEHSDLQYGEVDREDFKDVMGEEYPVEEMFPLQQEFTAAKFEPNNTELDHLIEERIAKQEGVWKCKVCGKTTTAKQHMKKHAEIHIKGMTHTCHICSKTFGTRPCLQIHVNNIHTELISCDLCGKSGMNRKSYYMHKQRNH